ncbi:MAG: MBL fold metallo-hydrolase, partial [Blastocatellia bacterium]
MTDRTPVYLRPNVVAEPLFGRWYAWPHLISPATAAMNVAGRHLRIMNSFVDAPHVHVSAVKNPRMLGGPFMDHPASRAGELRQLRDETASRQAHLIEFADSVRALHILLKEEAKGYCLDKLYAKVPPVLRGYVELFYDVQNQPSLRFYEPLLYKSEYYDREAQSLQCR